MLCHVAGWVGAGADLGQRALPDGVKVGGDERDGAVAFVDAEAHALRQQRGIALLPLQGLEVHRPQLVRVVGSEQPAAVRSQAAHVDRLHRAGGVLHLRPPGRAVDLAAQQCVAGARGVQRALHRSQRHEVLLLAGAGFEHGPRCVAAELPRPDDVVAVEAEESRVTAGVRARAQRDDTGRRTAQHDPLAAAERPLPQHILFARAEEVRRRAVVRDERHRGETAVRRQPLGSRDLVQGLIDVAAQLVRLVLNVVGFPDLTRRELLRRLEAGLGEFLCVGEDRLRIGAVRALEDLRADAVQVLELAGAGRLAEVAEAGALEQLLVLGDHVVEGALVQVHRAEVRRRRVLLHLIVRRALRARRRRLGRPVLGLVRRRARPHRAERAAGAGAFDFHGRVVVALPLGGGGRRAGVVRLLEGGDQVITAGAVVHGLPAQRTPVRSEKQRRWHSGQRHVPPLGMSLVQDGTARGGDGGRRTDNGRVEETGLVEEATVQGGGEQDRSSEAVDGVCGAASHQEASESG